MQQKRDAKKWHIMERALELFAEKGFTNTSVRSIADFAGVNLAMISYYFGSKQNLLEAILEQKLSQQSKEIEDIILEYAEEPVKLIDQLIDLFVDNFYRNRMLHNLVNREMILASTKTTAIVELVVNSRKKNRNHISTIISRGQAAGIFRKDIDIIMMTAILNGAISQVISHENYYCKAYQIKNCSEKMFVNKVVAKLRAELKKMFTAYILVSA